jgi:putative addiction module component (TIGR02574 family)
MQEPGADGVDGVDGVDGGEECVRASEFVSGRSPDHRKRLVVSGTSRAQILGTVYPAIDIDRLTVGERLEQVWDSLRCGAGVLPLSDAERAVIEARRAERRLDPGAAVPWETVRAELLSDQETDERRIRSSERA